jgi:CheY-like chemotaxis protein
MASILVGEADPRVRRLLVVLLKGLGHEAIVLGGGPAAPPPGDLLLLEPTSPLHLDQARHVRMLDPRLPIVAMSVLPADGGFLTQGPLAYLTKPFTSAGLAAAIESALTSASTA